MRHTLTLLGTLSLATLTPGAFGDDVLVTSWNTSAVLRYDADTGAFIAPLVAAGSGGLAQPHSAVVGPDGALYVTSFGTDSVKRYQLSDGAYLGDFVAPGDGGLDGPTDAFFGPDGQLWVSSRGPNPGIKRYDGTTGAFLGQFAGPGNGMTGTETGNFGPDGHFYLASGTNSQVNRYDGETGDFIDIFVPSGSGNLNNPHDLAFGPDGDLYVTSFGNQRVKRYDGTTGDFVENFITPSGGLSSPHGIDFRPDGMLYIASFGSATVQRFDSTTGTLVGDFVPAGSGGLSGAISLTFLPEDTLNLSSEPVGGPTTRFHSFGADGGETMIFTLGIGKRQRILPCNSNSVLWVERPLVIGVLPAGPNGSAFVDWSAPPPVQGLKVVIQSATPSGSCRVSDVHTLTLP